MTREEIIEHLDSIVGTYEILLGHGINSDILDVDDIEAIKEAISALSENKGDLISRQAVLDELEKLDWQELYLPIHFKQILDDVPSADIIEHARAIKEYCEKNLKTPHFWCEGCPLYKVMCQPVLSVPSMWDLPEGEKGGNDDNT